VKRVLAATAAMLLPVVLLGAAISALGGGAGLGGPIKARGSLGLAAAAQQAGFTGKGLRLAVAVGLAESSGDPHARHRNPPTPGCPGGSTDRGGWQLNDCYHPEVTDACADDLACAAVETYRISAGGSDWRAWTTYTSGAYQARLAAADRAIAALQAPGGCGLSPAANAARLLVIERFGITDIGGCDRTSPATSRAPTTTQTRTAWRTRSTSWSALIARLAGGSPDGPPTTLPCSRSST